VDVGRRPDEAGPLFVFAGDAMPLPLVYATAYVVYGSDERQPFVNVIHYRQIDEFDVTQADVDELANNIDSAVGPKIIAVIPDDCTYFHTSVHVNDHGVTLSSSAAVETGNGALTPPSLPDYAAVIIRKRTNVGGKTGRGRWYVGCLGVDKIDTGRVIPAFLPTYQQLANTMAANVVTAAGTWEPVHYSRKDVTMVQIHDVKAQAITGTQRRRRLRPAI